MEKYGDMYCESQDFLRYILKNETNRFNMQN